MESKFERISISQCFDEKFLEHSPQNICGFYNYWKSKKLFEYDIPARKDIHPEEITAFLPNITIVDRDSDTNELRYRLVGSNEVSLRGFDPTGRSIVEGFIGADKEEVLDNYQYVLNQQSFLYEKDEFIDAKGIHYVDEILFLPLRTNKDHAEMVLVYSEVTYGASGKNFKGK